MVTAQSSLRYSMLRAGCDIGELSRVPVLKYLLNVYGRAQPSVDDALACASLSAPTRRRRDGHSLA
jgi:hypothetical protein